MKKEPQAYFITLIHTLSFLKEEFAEYYPSWHFKSGAHGFATFTLDREYGLEEFRSFNTTFALAKGILLHQGNLAEMEAKLEEVQETYKAITLHRWDLMAEEGKMGDRKNRGVVIDFIRYDEDQFALGVRYQIRGDFAPYSGISPIPMPERSPSKAYQKLGEAFKHFRPLVAHDDVFLDIGCSPGGSSYYLLKRGYRVIGVDLLDIDPKVREDFPEGFLFLKQSFSELKTKHLRGLPPVNWIIFDVDCEPIEALTSLLKMMDKLDECDGLIMTIKLDRGFTLKDLGTLETMAKNHAYGVIRKGLLPSHEKEFCLVLQKTD